MPKLPVRQPHQNHVPNPPLAQTPSRPKVDGRIHSANKGKGKGKGIANPDSGPDSDGDGDDDDDEYVIKTSHLNGSLNGGKAKGKIIDGFTDDGDEDLYS
jgi:hypothetical protein